MTWMTLTSMEELPDRICERRWKTLALGRGICVIASCPFLANIIDGSATKATIQTSDRRNRGGDMN